MKFSISAGICVLLSMLTTLSVASPAPAPVAALEARQAPKDPNWAQLCPGRVAMLCLDMANFGPWSGQTALFCIKGQYYLQANSLILAPAWRAGRITTEAQYDLKLMCCAMDSQGNPQYSDQRTFQRVNTVSDYALMNGAVNQCYVHPTGTLNSLMVMVGKARLRAPSPSYKL